MLDGVSVYIVVRTDWLPQLWSDDQSRTIGSGSTSEEHNSGTSIWERSLLRVSYDRASRSLHTTHLQQGNSNTQSYTRTSQSPLILLNRPRIPLQLLQNIGKLELASLDRHQELRSGWGGDRLAWSHGLHGSPGGQTEHVGDLFGLIFFRAAEDV